MFVGLKLLFKYFRLHPLGAPRLNSLDSSQLSGQTLVQIIGLSGANSASSPIQWNPLPVVFFVHSAAKEPTSQTTQVPEKRITVLQVDQLDEIPVAIPDKEERVPVL